MNQFDDSKTILKRAEKINHNDQKQHWQRKNNQSNNNYETNGKNKNTISVSNTNIVKSPTRRPKHDWEKEKFNEKIIFFS